jgi:hypothetical protein
MMLIRLVSRGFPWEGGTIMAKKKGDVEMRHARIELPDADYQRLKRAADRVHISVAAYIRQAVMERIAEDERKMK